MTKLVRYQDACLYADHAAWFVRYRVPVRQENGSIKLKQRTKMLGRVADYPRESDIMPLKIEFMQRLNAGKFTPESLWPWIQVLSEPSSAPRQTIDRQTLRLGTGSEIPIYVTAVSLLESMQSSPTNWVPQPNK